MKKCFKRLLTAIVAIMMVVTSLENVNAAPSSIQLGKATKTNAYIAGVSFYYKRTTGGTYLYCLTRHKNAASNIKANLVSNSKYVDGGVAYILRNGYPNKKITGDSAKDYYITQTAVWWYLDKVKGSSNLGSDFKENGSDKYGLRKYVKNLMNEGYNHRNDARTGSVDAKFTVTTTDNSMKLADSYYVSNDITISSNLSDAKTVSLTGAPSDTKIVKANGSEMAYTGPFTMTNGTFKIKVPASSLNGTSQAIKISVNGIGSREYSVDEYQPTDSKMQTVSMYSVEDKKVTKELTLNISSSMVSIKKVDAATNEQIEGAKLELRDSNGRVITEWTSTVNEHIIRNLPNGTYTIHETAAPTGYILSDKDTSFTVTDIDKNFTISIENTAKKSVVNIVKVDQETNLPLAGAELIVRNSAGQEVARFVSTTQAYVLTDLANGTYTVEEVSAPAGYLKSNEKMTFTIDDDHLSHQVTFVNAKEVIVPDTATIPSGIIILIGMIITLSGIYYISGNAKKVK